MRWLRNRHLLTLLAMAALASGLVLVRSGTSAREIGPPAADLPTSLGGWTGSRGAPADILPEDPRARRTARWTYRKGEEVVWVAMGFYDVRNHPQSRPALDKIVQRRGASNLEQATLPLILPGAETPAVSLNHVVVTRGKEHVNVLYWYQLGPRSIAGNYRFRLAFFLNTLLGRSERLGLVRIASTGGEMGSASRGRAGEFLQSVYPAISTATVN